LLKQNNRIMLLDILTPEKKLFEGDVKSVKFPGTNGEFEILNNHAPIISTLTKGEIRVLNSNDEQEVFNINGGVIEMQNNKIIVLAD
tara:strand:+ start:7030 stop:7290 length:261 start_codon:yes stop_codon:yes gene_type:complete